ncbi:MAG: hypothetical protein H7062_18815 [Candidatus Saccharimonas sp.]|nr:hypothetical protein [Planctomycetaceae bacterium]
MMLKDFLEPMSYLATIIGVPVAIWAFRSEKDRDRRDRSDELEKQRAERQAEREQKERQTYLEAHANYIDYLVLCLQYPELDAFDLSADDPEVKKAGVDINKLTLFTILISLLESGFVLYRDHATNIRNLQWKGWHEYMVMWAERAAFREVWPLLGPQFDGEFVEHMQGLVAEAAGRHIE